MFIGRMYEWTSPLIQTLPSVYSMEVDDHESKD